MTVNLKGESKARLELFRKMDPKGEYTLCIFGRSLVFSCFISCLLFKDDFFCFTQTLQLTKT
jgi:hypothetical protein